METKARLKAEIDNLYKWIDKNVNCTDELTQYLILLKEGEITGLATAALILKIINEDEFTEWVAIVYKKPKIRETWKEKAMQWDSLKRKISKCYSDESESDLLSVGEIAASHLGFLG